jgi:ectoine hydroxylase-related dioxygenase (phytanoyl-CoA dioxygenase family)
VIWHQALPHGASPNRGTRPRMVQYINMYPTRIEQQQEWI